MIINLMYVNPELKLPPHSGPQIVKAKYVQSSMIKHLNKQSTRKSVCLN